jgi:proline iminopeptidase
MSPKRVLQRLLAVVVVTAGLIVSLILSFVAAAQSARITAHVAVLVTVALAVCFVSMYWVSSLSARLWKPASTQLPLRFSAAITVLFAVAVWLAVLRPLGYPHVAPVARTNTQYWQLSTGSRIAYSVYEPPAGVAVRPEPIVFLHGGPGVMAFDSDHNFYRQFARDGFKVYLFDQAGSGLSDRLPHGTDYTVERFVADLEAIRQQIGAQRMILIGHSWGGTLAAHYAVAYSGNVAKLVFHSPGPVWMQSFVPFEVQRTEAQVPKALPPPRVMAAILLARINPAAAENLASQEELNDWAVANVDPGELVCKGDKAGLDELRRQLSPSTLAGTNFYALINVNRELKQQKMDVRPQLLELQIPAIALEGQCDLIPWEEHSQLQKSIPGLQEFYIPNAAHYINFSQPQKLAAVIRSFLLDQPPPFPAYEGTDDPRPPLSQVAGH